MWFKSFFLLNAQQSDRALFVSDAAFHIVLHYNHEQIQVK